MERELVVLLGGQISGTVIQDARGRMALTYAPGWQDSELAFPLSLSMPLVQPKHGDEVIRPYMDGLLPDNEQVLRDWGRRFGVSGQNPFSLLTHVGEDAAGAVQFIPAERLSASTLRDGSVEYLTDDDVEERLRLLVADHSSWRISGDSGYFSLAGAQPKTALLWDGQRWALPSGNIPTTHILKPPAVNLEALAVNEHLCLRTAGALGLLAANSDVIRLGDQTAILVERYDRMQTAEGIVRIHQEDFCQAAGVSPRIKYEAEGGPDARRVVQIIRDYSSSPEEDVLAFLASLGLHWALGAPDAHAKNYSVLIAPRGQVRLAPLYDIISVLPYPAQYHAPKVRLAMSIGGEYRMHHIRARHWDRLADSIGFDPQQVRQLLGGLISAIPDVVSAIANDAREHDLDGDFVDAFEASVNRNAHRCVRILEDGLAIE